MDEDEIEMEVETVTLTDEQGRTLACTIEHAIEVDDQDYVLLVPIDSPVEIYAWQENGDDEEALLVEEEAEIDRLFAIAKAVLEEQNLTLKRTAVTLTVEGDLPDEEPEDEEFLDGNGEEEEELQLLASFYCEEQEYGIYAPLDPMLILAQLDANNQPQLLSPEELEKLEPMLPMIEDQLMEQFE
jgi:hypothetical protein